MLPTMSSTLNAAAVVLRPRRLRTDDVYEAATTAILYEYVAYNIYKCV